MRFMKTTYFQVFTCRSLWFDILILVLNFFAFSTLALALHNFTRKHCLLISSLRIRTGYT